MMTTRELGQASYEFYLLQRNPIVFIISNVIYIQIEEWANARSTIV
jgi:hypothetical protein